MYKKLNKQLTPCILCLFFAHFVAQGQDPQFTQFYAAPIYLNPAFTGSTGQGRLIANHRNQWPDLEANYVTYAVSYDQFVRGYNSGIGLMIKQDNQGAGAGTPLKSTEVALSYAYLAQIDKFSGIQIGLQASAVSRNLNFNEFIFPSQITNRGIDPNISSGENFPQTTQLYPSFAIGALYFNERFWGGASLHHFNTPNLSFFGGEDPLPMKISAHAGYLIPLTKDRKNEPDLSDKVLTPVFMYLRQGRAEQLSIGTYFNYNSMVFGFWYRGIPTGRYAPNIPKRDAVAFLLGIQLERITFAYSYDYTISRLQGFTGGSHEISLQYSFEVNHNYRKKGRRNLPNINCPDPRMRRQKGW